MKPTTPDADENSLDLLLFRYAEGDLGADQARELEARLASDAALRDELSFWKESFVEPDVYDTTHLESGMLVPVEPRWTGSYFGTWVFVLTLMVSLFRPVPVEMETRTALILAPVITPVETDIVTESRNSGEPTTLSRITHIPVTPRKKPMPEVTEVERNVNESIISSLIPEIKSRPLEVKEAIARLSLTGVRVQKVKHKPVAGARTLTRRQQRKILKMKEKARQQRQADQFLKGNVPYVVPLNSENF
jgi:hypothetical protein